MSRLTWVDWFIILAFIGVSIATGILLSRRGRKSVREYFTSGGATPWWLLGTSMVATTFAADTPLTLSGWVVTNGIAQNWFWWCQVPVTMLGVFFIARLWRRANLVTDNELVDLRYSGTSAAVLRGSKALFYSLVYGCIVMGWVNLAMTKIIQLSLPNIPHVPVLDRAMLWTYLHTPLSDELPPKARDGMRSGQLEPLALYYRHWRLQDRPERPEVMRELDVVFRRLAAIEKSVAVVRQSGALPPGSAASRSAGSDASDPNDLAKYSAYVDSLWDLPVCTRLGLEDRKAEMAALWSRQESDAPAPTFSPPPVLALLHAVNLAVMSVNKFKIIVLLFVIVVAYTVISGLWGVLITDFFQFWIAMAGCIVLAVLATQHLGGMDAMLRQMADMYTPDRARGMVSLIPIDQAGDLDLMPSSHFLVFVLFAWYVLQFTDGGSYLAQRMLAAKDERHAALGYLWYGVAHYCLRMWPWIVVGFAAAVMFPYARDAVTGQYPGQAIAEEGYVRVMLAVLPQGMMGLMLAAFLAAYMSTISSQLNLGASYLLNDFYRPFVRPHASERHYVAISQVSTIVMAAVGLIISLFFNAISEAWFALSTISAGIGVIFLLRWFWWRINAWSEIVCLAVLVTLGVLIKLFPNAPPAFLRPYPMNLLFLAPLSVGIALLVTLLTRPVDSDKLIAFVRKVQPGGPGWRKIEDMIRTTDPGFSSKTPLSWANARRWLIATAAIFSFLIGSQKLVVGDVFTSNALVPNRLLGVLFLAIGGVLSWLAVRSFSRHRWQD